MCFLQSENRIFNKEKKEIMRVKYTCKICYITKFIKPMLLVQS